MHRGIKHVANFTRHQHLIEQKTALCYLKKKRPKQYKNQNKCLFCGEETSRAEHSFQKLSLTKDIHDKSVALGEDRIVACLAEEDLVAIEAKYH